MTTPRLILLAFVLATGELSAQVDVKDLSGEIDTGHITLDSAVGNGGSSGDSVQGYLINERTVETHIDVYLAHPLFMVNRGSRQNMVAAQVYLGDGGFRSDGLRSFITLRPKVRTRIRFVAYCVDFEKDNPTGADEFTIGSMPPNLSTVMANIRTYAIANPDVDMIRAAQVAIWLAQGETTSDIRSKFDFTPADEILARSLIK